MKATISRTQPPEIFTFDRRPTPLNLYFIVVPSLVVLMIVLNLTMRHLPLALMALLVMVAGSCLFWIKLGVEQLGGVTLELNPEELQIKRLLGGASYPWNKIALIKIVDPGATLSDGGRSDEGRVGIGLYLRKEGRELTPETPPDEVLVSGSREYAETIMNASEKIIAYSRRMTGGERGATGGFGRQGKGLRRPAKPPAAA